MKVETPIGQKHTQRKVSYSAPIAIGSEVLAAMTDEHLYEDPDREFSSAIARLSAAMGAGGDAEYETVIPNRRKSTARGTFEIDLDADSDASVDSEEYLVIGEDVGVFGPSEC